MKKTIIITIIILIALILTALIFDWGRRESETTDSDTIATTQNEQQNSTEDLSSLIVVFSPKNNQEINNPIVISGKARGNWYFEASFPVKLLDVNKNVIIATHATALSDWMTTDFVNFTATIEYDSTSITGPALIELSKDNPSGNPEFDKSIFVPVVLK